MLVTKVELVEDTLAIEDERSLLLFLNIVMLSVVSFSFQNFDPSGKVETVSGS